MTKDARRFSGAPLADYRRVNVRMRVFFMNAASSTFSFAHRLRLVAAGLLGMLGCALLWAGFGVSDLLALQREAVAESAPTNPRRPPLALISKEQAAVLQSTVDSAALSLGSVLAADNRASRDSKGSLTSVASALSTLTFGLGGEVYFTVWEGTTIMHAPLSPDAEGMDLADAVDGRGAAFVLGMAHAAANGGGFLQTTLPRQFSGADGTDAIDAALAAASGDANSAQDLDLLIGEIARSAAPGPEQPRACAAISGDVADVPHDMAEIFTGMPEYCPINNNFAVQCGGRNAPPEPALDATPVEQVVYVRHIPGSRWHIAAFMPVDARPRPGFSSAWSLTADNAADRQEAGYRKGLCVSGFSLAGLAGLMLIPGRARARKDDGNGDEA